MNWFELLWRKIEMKFFDKKYCNYKNRHGHNLIFQKSNDKQRWEKILYYKCSVCGQKAYMDCIGDLTKY